jgi:hypothetical protein
MCLRLCGGADSVFLFSLTLATPARLQGFDVTRQAVYLHVLAASTDVSVNYSRWLPVAARPSLICVFMERVWVGNLGPPINDKKIKYSPSGAAQRVR